MVIMIFKIKRKCSNVYRNLHLCSINNREIPNNLKGKSKSSQEWLTRQLKDPYVELSKKENLRCRSAYKLTEINERFQILKPGQCVVDCGAAPGSWLQVLVKEVNSKGADADKPVGKVVGVDISQLTPVEGAIVLNRTDFTTDEAQSRIKDLLDGRKLDVTLSDMAPRATGTKSLDHECIMKLAYSVFKFALLNSNLDATLLIKLFMGNQSKEFQEQVARFYANVRFVKPDASRGDSSEMFILARGFKGIKTNA